MISNVVADYTEREASEEWDLDGLWPRWRRSTAPGSPPTSSASLDRDAIVEEFLEDAVDAYTEREKEIEGLNEGLMRDLERYIVLQVVDIRWREHLENMDYMREGIHLRGMAQKDPLVEYRNEGHSCSSSSDDSIRDEVVVAPLPRGVEAATRRRAAPPQPVERRREQEPQYEHESLAGADAIAARAASAFARRRLGGGRR